MRAVSFFGEAGRTGADAIPDWPGAGGAGGRMPEVGGGGMVPEPPAGGAGFKGIVGLPVSGGGFGGVTLLSGFVIGAPPGFGGGGIVPESGFVATPEGIGGIAGADGVLTAAGADGGGIGGFGAAGAAGGWMMDEIGIFDVSFFGTMPTGAGAVVPGTLMRTVSRLIDGCSAFGGRVIRMVSFFVESSSCVFDGSAMRVVRGGKAVSQRQRRVSTGFSVKFPFILAKTVTFPIKRGAFFI